MSTNDLKIIVVEDDPIISFTLSKILRHSFRAVETADNGLTGLDIISKGDFDVIVTDLQMPVMDGNTMIMELRARGIDTPIIICSAYTFEDADKYKCKWLSKPIIIHELVELIKASAQ